MDRGDYRFRAFFDGGECVLVPSDYISEFHELSRGVTFAAEFHQNACEIKIISAEFESPQELRLRV